MIIEAKVYQTFTLCLKLRQALHMHYLTGSPRKELRPTNYLYSQLGPLVQPRCKELVSYHSCPYNNHNKNLGNLKISHFLGNVRVEVEGQTAPTTYRDTSTQRESPPDHLPGAEATRTINWKEHLVVILMDRWRRHVYYHERNSLVGGYSLRLSWLLPPGSTLGSHGGDSRNVLSWLWQREGKSNHGEIITEPSP